MTVNYCIDSIHLHNVLLKLNHLLYGTHNSTMDPHPITDEEAVAAADKEMEARANRAKELLSQRYVGLKRQQVRVKRVHGVEGRSLQLWLGKCLTDLCLSFHPCAASTIVSFQEDRKNRKMQLERGHVRR